MWRFWTLLFGLSACGGGGGGGQRATVDSFSQMHAAVTAAAVTPLAQVPTNGRHIYTGMMALNLPIGGAAATEYVGAFEIGIAMNGSTASASGTADSFAGGGGALSGALTVSGGTLFPTADPDRDFLILADLDGHLGEGGTDYALDGTIVADFYGADAAAMAGTVFGDIAQGGNVDIFDGAFAAEKDP
jgi:hypothetical protein